MATFSGDVQYTQNGTVTNPSYIICWLEGVFFVASLWGVDGLMKHGEYANMGNPKN